MGDVTCTLREARQIILGSKTTHSFLLLGKPGIGKTSLVRQLANGKPFVTESASRKAPEDATGIPDKHKTKPWTIWLIPDWIGQFTEPDAEGVIFIDDLTAASQSVMLSFLGFLCDREVGGHKIGEKVLVLAAGNRREDFSACNEPPLSITTRFGTLIIEPALNDWIEDFAVPYGISEELIYYLRYADGAGESAFYAVDPKRVQRSAATPRTWEKADDAFKSFRSASQTLLTKAIGAHVGEGQAVQFLAFVDLQKEMPNPEEVLANPCSIKMPEKTDRQYALIGAMYSAVKRQPTQQRVDALCQFAQALPEELRVFLLSDVVMCPDKRLPKLFSTSKLRKATLEGLHGFLYTLE